MPEQPKQVHILAFPDVQLLDVCGPLQVFASANLQAQQQGIPDPYQMQVIAAQADAVHSSAGLGLQTCPLPPSEERSHTLIVAGGRGVQQASRDAELVAWLHQRAHAAERVASVCTGAFLLGATGLLDGRRVATHWQYCEALAQQYPALQVDADPIFINDGKFWTSAGITAGIDLALALVEQDLGHAMALAVARHLVVFLKRPGGQSQFSAALTLQHASAAGDGRFADLHAWIIENLAGDLGITALASRMAMSERSFVRHYRAHTGTTPAKAIEQLRVEAARRLLTDTSQPVKRVASRCGFGSEETLRRSFLRTLSVTPQAYRERFSR